MCGNWNKRPGENADPIGDHAHSPVAGIVASLSGRVLFKLVHVCAVYCRFCFAARWSGRARKARCRRRLCQGVDYIHGHGEIWESS